MADLDWVRGMPREVNEALLKPGLFLDHIWSCNGVLAHKGIVLIERMKWGIKMWMMPFACESITVLCGGLFHFLGWS